MQKEIFHMVKGPRELDKVRHNLEDVLRIALLGTICAITISTGRCSLVATAKSSNRFFNSDTSFK